MIDKTLWIGAGHSRDAGGTSGSGLFERQLNIEIADIVSAALLRKVTAQNLDVMLIPHKFDLQPSIEWVRYRGAERAKGDIAVELHLQGIQNTSQRGAFILYGDGADGVAHTLLDDYVSRGQIGQWGSGIYRSTTAALKWHGWSDYGWNKGLDPSALTLIFEMGHLTNREDAAIFKDPEGKRIQALAIAAGLFRLLTGQVWDEG